MITWGISANSHDASLAVFKDGELKSAVLAKDYSKVPNDPHLNWSMVSVARQEYGEPDSIQWYELPKLKTLRQWYAGQGWLWEENNIRKYLQQWNIIAPIKYTQHHLSHAAYAYYTQPHDDCAVICLDSIGEFETLTIWHGKKNKLKKIHSQGYPHSLGLFYSAMTQRLGLVAQRDEYLVAQWGAKGDKHKYFYTILQELVETNSIGEDPYIKMRENMHRGVSWWRPELTSQDDLNDIAAATQAVFEYCVVNIAAWTKIKTGSKHLALAGGGALNRDAVNLLRDKWNTVHVPQNPGDPGSCVGAVLAKTQQRIILKGQWH
jgi:carbamoyltransferase